MERARYVDSLCHPSQSMSRTTQDEREPWPSTWESPSVRPRRPMRSSDSGIDVSTNPASFLQIGPGTRIRYVGPGEDDRDAANVVADCPVPSDCPVYCFEVEILCQGSSGLIGVGFATRNVEVNVLPGWAEGSYGYHGDDGNIFRGSGQGTPFGPEFITGDVISCIWCKVRQTISFAKNGVDLGVAFRNVRERKLYPTIGLRTFNEEAVANFGAKPFLCKPPKELLAEIREEAYLEMGSVPIPAPSGSPDMLLGDLVKDYLLHSGFPATARAIAPADGPSSVLESDAAALAAIQSAVLAGDADRAEELLASHLPDILGEEPNISFRLKCQRFMEMSKPGNEADAISYGMEHLSEASAQHPMGKEILSDAAMVLAFPDSPDACELRASYRWQLVSAIVSCLQIRAGRPPCSPLERLVRHAKLVWRELGMGMDPLLSPGEDAHLQRS
uniref:Ran-binding protein 10 n=1 Tax=Tetraselmis sp. GSL018 TaxID=582737 RepID=A0A061RML2_9CHLO